MRRLLDRYGILYESYSTSPEVNVSAQKKPTVLYVVLYDSQGNRAEGKTYYIGEPIKIETTLYWKDAEGVQHPVEGKTIKFYHRLNDGAAEVIDTKTTDYNGYCETTFTLDKPGKHTFYTMFEGDEEYEGCQKLAKMFAR